MSLARQPGAKNAAMQYLMSSTNKALQQATESHEQAPKSVPSPVPSASGATPSGGGTSSSSMGAAVGAAISAAAAAAAASSGAGGPRLGDSGSGRREMRPQATVPATSARPHLRLNLQGVGNTGPPKVSSARASQMSSSAARGLLANTQSTSSAGSMRPMMAGTTVQRSTPSDRQAVQVQRQRSAGGDMHPPMR